MNKEDFEVGQTYDLTPQEAQELHKKGFILVWKNKTEHSEGEPKIREYTYVGKHDNKKL